MNRLQSYLLVAVLGLVTAFGSQPMQAEAAPGPGQIVEGTFGKTLEGHAAVALGDGRVLITGGIDRPGGPTTDAAWIYDPDEAVFRPISPMSSSRRGHAMVLLNDGRVLVIGGETRSSPNVEFDPLRSVEVFDPAAEQFAAAGDLSVPRAFANAMVLPDGRVFVIGPGGQAMPSVDIFDPQTGSFEQVGLPESSPGHAALLPDENMLLTGLVRDDAGDFRFWAGILDLPSHAVRVLDPPPTNHPPFTVISLSDGRVLLLSVESQAQIFYWRSGAFQVIEANIELPGLGSTATVLGDGRVILTGGVSRAESSDEQIISDKVWIFDPRTDSFGMAGRMERHRAGHVAAALDDSLLIIGGDDPSTAEVVGFTPQPQGLPATGSGGLASDGTAVTMSPRNGALVVATALA